ncbi:nuclease [Caballeronia udeis]|uniref:Nuclease n=1 Tax=Caballeronia udeis TaxID=1232866 RepID=A0A158JWR1_9BURK|nr:ParB/RepB/Spo0J family partition protein [Caballeronia udeis]SAL73165.1 nuclease [Caballeronia udeis]
MQTVNAQDANVNTTDNVSAVELPNAISAGAAVEMIPLRSLVESPYNQRKKARTEATILEFADNIRAVGLLQNLVVHPMKKRAKKAQTYGVAAGETRRLGLLFNVERGDITSDYLVPCKVISEADAILTSATENDLRKPPHPADQFIAYKALTDQGRSPEFIAAVFKVTPKTVAGHLKLASVSPKLFDLFADDEMELEQIQALAMTDDHQTQEAVWFGAQSDWARNPRELRARLKGDKLSLNDRMVRFVTVEAYEAAGGMVERDLFSENDEGFILNRDVLMRVFDQRVASEVKTIEAEGWAWVESRPKFDYDEHNQFTQLYAQPAPLNPEQQQHFDALQKRYDEVTDALQAHYDVDEGEDGHLSDEVVEGLEAEDNKLACEIAEIEEREGEFTPAQMQVSGAIVYVSHNGGLTVHRGLVRREDREEARTMMQDSGVELPRSMTKKEKSAHSEKLLLNLTAHRTAAVQSALAMNANVALVTIVHKLALDFLYTGYIDGASVVQVSSREAFHDMSRAAPELEQNEHARGLREYVQTWRKLLPANPNELFGWLLEQPQDRLLNVLSVCTALSINGVSRNDAPNAVNAIAGALDLNLSAYWQPTRESYLNHVSKDRIVAVVSGVVSAEEGKRVGKMKKGEAAEAAEKLLAGKNWLPEFMSAAEVHQVRYYANDADEDTDEADDEQGGDANGAELADHVEAAQGETVHVTDNAEPWHFPKAADFAQQSDDVAPAPANVVRPIGTALALNPAAAWPFPPTNPGAFKSVQQAA